MALGVLSILFVALAILSLICLVLLYMRKGMYSDKNIIFLIMSLYSIVISCMNYTALPSNYILLKVLALVWGLLAASAFILKVTNADNFNKARLILAISLIGGMVQLLL